MACVACAAELRESWRFCPICGERVGSAGEGEARASGPCAKEAAEARTMQAAAVAAAEKAVKWAAAAERALAAATAPVAAAADAKKLAVELALLAELEDEVCLVRRCEGFWGYGMWMEWC